MKIINKKQKSLLSRIKSGSKILSKSFTIRDNSKTKNILVSREGIGIIKTTYGNFWYFNFHISDKWKNYSVIVRANKLDKNLNPVFKNKKTLILRIDSGCDTGQIFDDLTCDCKKQLQKAMNIIAKEKEGIIIRINGQDGRGMGLPFKLATLWIQEELEINTIEAAKLIGNKEQIEKRNYVGAISILKFFNISPKIIINLLTNNPKKTKSLLQNGFSKTNQIPFNITPTKNTRIHLEAKKDYFKCTYEN